MKRVFLDTNIILDLLGEIHPFYEPAARIATLADQEKLQLVVAPLSIATANYVLCRFETPEQVKDKLRKFSILCEIAKMDQNTVEKALNSKFAVLEDALQYFTALASACDVLLTRNQKDFRLSAIPVLSATAYLETLR